MLGEGRRRWEGRVGVVRLPEVPLSAAAGLQVEIGVPQLVLLVVVRGKLLRAGGRQLEVRVRSCGTES